MEIKPHKITTCSSRMAGWLFEFYAVSATKAISRREIVIVHRKVKKDTQIYNSNTTQYKQIKEE